MSERKSEMSESESEQEVKNTLGSDSGDSSGEDSGDSSRESSEDSSGEDSGDSSGEDSEESKKKRKLEIYKIEENKRFEYVYHISDIHIKLRGRHEEYEQVFQNLYKYMRGREGIIVITGDIVHRKDDLSSDCVRMVRTMLIELSNIMPTVVILGNHDIIDEKRDAVSVLFEPIPPRNLHFMKSTGIYQYGNITFGVTRLGDKIIKAEEIKTRGEYLIALYHGLLYESHLYSGFAINSDCPKIKTFEGYDYALLGDNHKYQIKKNVCYAGSLIQQDIGESLDKHGLVKITLGKKMEHVEIKNKWGSGKIRVKNGKIIEEPKLLLEKPKAKIIVEFEDTDEQDKKIIGKQIRNKYKGNIVIPMTKVSVEEKKLSKINNKISSQENIRTICEKYLETKQLTKEEKNQIMKYYKNDTKGMDIDRIWKSHQWSIKLVKFSNFGKYGKNNLLEIKKGSTHIDGDNGTGKTMCRKVITACLFNEPNIHKIASGDKAECTVVLIIDGTEYSVTRITTKIKKNKWQMKTQFCKGKVVVESVRREVEKRIQEHIGSYEDFVNSNMITHNNLENFLQKGAMCQYAQLKKLLKVDIFDNLHKSATAKFSSFQNKLKLVQSKHDKLQEEYDEKHNRLENEKRLIKKQNTDLMLYNEKLKTLKKKEKEYFDKLGSVRDGNIEESQEELGEQLEESKKKIKQLEKSIGDIAVDYDEKSHVKLLNDVKKLEWKLNSMAEIASREKSDRTVCMVKLNKCFEQIKSNSSKLDHLILIDIDGNHSVVKEEISDISKHIVDLKHEINMSTSEIKHLEKYKYYEYNDKCSSCVKRAKMDRVDESIARFEELNLLVSKNKKRIVALEKKLSEHRRILEQLEQNIDIEKEIKTIENNILVQRTEITKLMDQVCELKHGFDTTLCVEFNEKLSQLHQIEQSAKLKSFCDNLKHSLEDEQENYSDLKSKLNISKNADNYKQYREMYDRVKRDIDIIDQKKDVLHRKYADTKSSIAKLQSFCKHYEDNDEELDDLLQQKKCIDVYRDMVNPMGLPYLLLKDYVSMVNNRVNEMLSVVGCVDISHFQISLSEPIKGKARKADLCVSVLSPLGVPYDASQVSGYEGAILDVCIRASCASLSSIPKCDTFILDEPLTAADRSNRDNVALVLNFIKNIYSNVVIISHDFAVRTSADFPLIVTRSKKSDGSFFSRLASRG